MRLGRKTIALLREGLQSQIADATRKLVQLQTECKHPKADRKAGSSAGNYDPSADSYWYDCECPDCGKTWRERQ